MRSRLWRRRWHRQGLARPWERHLPQEILLESLKALLHILLGLLCLLGLLHRPGAFQGELRRPLPLLKQVRLRLHGAQLDAVLRLLRGAELGAQGVPDALTYGIELLVLIEEPHATIFLLIERRLHAGHTGIAVRRQGGRPLAEIALHRFLLFLHPRGHATLCPSPESRAQEQPRLVAEHDEEHLLRPLLLEMLTSRPGGEQLLLRPVELLL
mmetsp:Transcript_58012/g.124620  ORF Transcript_58012/g.124620 Transcript_58012/m.124620 type:complete len:212 (+) Transcript_58012:1493-2128(+)